MKMMHEEWKRLIDEIYGTMSIRKSLVVAHCAPEHAQLLCDRLNDSDYPVDGRAYHCATKDEKILVRFLQHHTRMLVIMADTFREIAAHVAPDINLIMHVGTAAAAAKSL